MLSIVHWIREKKTSKDTSACKKAAHLLKIEVQWQTSAKRWEVSGEQKKKRKQKKTKKHAQLVKFAIWND